MSEAACALSRLEESTASSYAVIVVHPFNISTSLIVAYVLISYTSLLIHCISVNLKNYSWSAEPLKYGDYR